MRREHRRTRGRADAGRGDCARAQSWAQGGVRAEPEPEAVRCAPRGARSGIRAGGERRRVRARARERAAEARGDGRGGVAAVRAAALDDPTTPLADDTLFVAETQVAGAETLAEVRADAGRLGPDQSVCLVCPGNGLDGVCAYLDCVSHADEDTSDDADTSAQWSIANDEIMVEGAHRIINWTKVVVRW